MSYQPLDFSLTDATNNGSMLSPLEDKSPNKEESKKKKVQKTPTLLVNKVTSNTQGVLPKEITPPNYVPNPTRKVTKLEDSSKPEETSEETDGKKLKRRSSFLKRNSFNFGIGFNSNNGHSIGGSTTLNQSLNSSSFLKKTPEKSPQKMSRTRSSSTASFLKPNRLSLDKIEEMKTRLEEFAKTFHQEYQTLEVLKEKSAQEQNADEWQKNEAALIRAKFQDLGIMWQALEYDMKNILDPEEEPRVLSKIDAESLAFNGSKDSRRLSLTSPSKSIKGEKTPKHIDIARKCSASLALDLPPEGSLIFEEKQNIKKLASLCPSYDVQGDQFEFVSLYAERLLHLGKMLQENDPSILIKPQKGEASPLSDHAKDFAKQIQSHVKKSIEPDLQEGAVRQCCIEFGTRIVVYAKELQQMQMKQISNATKTLIAYMLNPKHVDYNQEGIFRLSGNKATIDSLIDGLLRYSTSERGFNIDKLETKPGTNDLAVALKTLFGKMKLFAAPQLEKEFLELGTAIPSLSKDEIIEKLRKLVGQLTPDQQKDLKSGLIILSEANKNVKKTKMDPSNLAIVFGPRLCDPKSTNPSEIVTNNLLVKNVTEQLILLRNEVFD